MPILFGLALGLVALVAFASRSAKSDPPTPAPGDAVQGDGNRYVRSAQGLLEHGVQYEIAAFLTPLPTREDINAHLAKDWIGGSIRWYPGDDPKAFPPELPALNDASSLVSIIVTRGIWNGPLTQVDTTENVVLAVNPTSPVL
jgi:hypothetical protein